MERFIQNFPLITVVALVLVGLFGMLFKKNLIKVLMALVVVESAVNLLLVVVGYRAQGIAPIFTNAPGNQVMVLPTVQALTLTAIVIGVATSALLLSFAMIIYKNYGTLDVRKIRKLKG